MTASGAAPTRDCVSMAGLIPIPDPDRPGEPSRLWINPAHLVTAAAIFDTSHEPHRLLVEVKLQGLNLSRHWLATGTDDELAAA